MTRRTVLVAAAVLAAPFAGWGIAWAYVSLHPVPFWTFTVSAALVALCVWLCLRLTGEGKHGGKGRDRDEREWPEILAAMNRPAEIATEPPWWEDGQQDQPQMLTAPLAGAPVLHHNDYSVPRYDGHAEWSGGILAQRLAIALAAVTSMRGLIGKAALLGAREAEAKVQRLQEENRRLKDERDYPDLLSGQYGAWVTGEFKAVDAELVRAAERAAAETAAGAS